MGDLSANFSRAEFADKVTGECDVRPELILALEQLRMLAGKAIHINSGYRSPATNAAAGGVGHSQHMEGRAADISIKIVGGPPEAWLNTFQLFVLAEQVEGFRNGGIGIYPGSNFIHVDVRDGRARWARVNGEYRHIEDALA
jgi:uncharacterized protein YcbK (DUF882 family)